MVLVGMSEAAAPGRIPVEVEHQIERLAVVVVPGRMLVVDHVRVPYRIRSSLHRVVVGRG
jgi:hypothetical protein